MKRDEVVADQSFKIVVGSIQDHVFSKASLRVLFRIILYRGVVVAFLQGRTLELKVCLHMKVAQLSPGTDMYSMFLRVFNVHVSVQCTSMFRMVYVDRSYMIIHEVCSGGVCGRPPLCYIYSCILPAPRTLYSPTGEVYPMGWGSRGSGNSMNLWIHYSGFIIFYIQ